MEYEECLKYLKSFAKTLEIEPNKLIQSAFKFKVSNRIMDDLEDLYNQGVTDAKFRLVKNFYGKWMLRTER